jgi:hypothetical protein
MTWQDAKTDALELVEKISRSQPSNEVVVLTEFDSKESYWLVRGKDHPIAWNYHTECLRVAAQLLERRGFKVCRVTIKADEYFKWLTASGKDHSPEAIREYARQSLP